MKPYTLKDFCDYLDQIAKEWGEYIKGKVDHLVDEIVILMDIIYEG